MKAELKGSFPHKLSDKAPVIVHHLGNNELEEDRSLCPQIQMLRKPREVSSVMWHNIEADRTKSHILYRAILVQQLIK